MAEKEERSPEEVRAGAVALFESEHYAFLVDLHITLSATEERALLAKPDYDEGGYRGFHSRHAGRVRLFREIEGHVERAREETAEQARKVKEKQKREEEERYAGG